MNDLPPRRVLVLDPNAGLAGLRDVPDAHTHVVATISQALRALGESGYDAVMLEVDGADGMSFLVRIKAAAPRVPLVALVPPANPALEELARQSGADDVLSAPPADGLLRRSRRAIQDCLEVRRRLGDSIARARTTMARTFELADIPVARLRTLVVEDDDDQILLTRRAFKTLGLKLDLAPVRDGPGVLALLSAPDAPSPTLILLDLHLPRMSGLDVLRWIRSKRAFDRAVVFIMSTSSRPEEVEEARSLGADGFFTKPVGQDAFVDLLRVALTRWRLINKARVL